MYCVQPNLTQTMLLYIQWTGVAQHLDFVSPQKAGLLGVAGPCAVRSVAAESRCGAAAVSLTTACAREQSRKGGPATPSPALVSPHVI